MAKDLWPINRRPSSQKQTAAIHRTVKIEIRISKKTKMRGLKLVATATLAANKGAYRSANQLESADKQASFVEKKVFGRRKALQQILCVGAVTAAAPKTAFGLDMDAFMSKELENDTKNCDPKRDPKCIPKLTADEAQCKYGQSGDVRGEACKRVKEGGGKLPGATKEKSLGGAYAM